MIDLRNEYLPGITAILDKYFPDCEVRAFGSRVNRSATRFSDLDLALVGRGKLDWRRMEALKDAFAESNLPIMVDVVDWHAISAEFQEVIAKNNFLLKEKSPNVRKDLAPSGSAE